MTDIGIYIAPVAKENSGPTFGDKVYAKAYPQLFSLLIKHGARVCLVSDRDRTYKGNGVFSEWWEAVLEGDQKITYQFHQEDITIAFLYDKHRFGDDEGLYVLNPKEVVAICSDKMKSYQHVPKLHPFTQWAETSEDVAMYLKVWQYDKVAIKSVDSNAGRHVYVGSPSKYTGNLPLPVVVQEYVETSGGIPGLVDGRHDLRIGLYNGEVIHGRLRTPPEGGYIANIGYGGTHYVLDIASLPADAKALAQAVDSTFSKYSHRFISVDFALTDKGWKVFELNCWPGLVDCKAGKAEQEYMNTLAQRLIMSAKEYTT